jgi:hypothetical protein
MVIMGAAMRPIVTLRLPRMGRVTWKDTGWITNMVEMKKNMSVTMANRETMFAKS